MNPTDKSLWLGERDGTWPNVRDESGKSSITGGSPFAFSALFEIDLLHGQNDTRIRFSERNGDDSGPYRIAGRRTLYTRSSNKRRCDLSII